MTTTPLDNHDPLLSIDQTAAILGINRNTLSAMIKDGSAPPFITVGRRFFILSSEVRAWVQNKHRRAKASQRKSRQPEYRVAQMILFNDRSCSSTHYLTRSDLNSLYFHA